MPLSTAINRWNIRSLANVSLYVYGVVARNLIFHTDFNTHIVPTVLKIQDACIKAIPLY